MTPTTTVVRRRLAALCVLPIMAIGVLVLATLPAGYAAAAEARPVVHVDSGVVRGVQHGNVATYLGIPYAAPPNGNLRWRPPEAVTAWQGVRDASTFGPSCPQATQFNPFLPPGPISEDCLYLNVYAPARQHRHGNDSPVLFWIHGGGLVQDGARNYDASKLAAQGVVVVTLNYRLGALGFLADPALAAHPGGPTGNYGWMDQQAALRWVQHNIEAFGGNPHDVTIAGQSAGGLSVLAQLVSPGARGLFQRAIVQSGAFALHQRSLTAAESTGQSVADAVGCAQDTANCLRHASYADLNSAFGVAIPGYVDGTVLPASIDTALAAGRFARVPVLNGITHDEERLFVAALGITVSQGTDVPIPDRPISDANYQSNIAAVLGVSDARAAEVAAEYPTSAYGSSALVAFSTLVSDANFACPALQVDNWTAPYARTFAYQFDEPGQAFGVATHGSELPYLFDLPNSPFPTNLNAEEQTLAANMRLAWAHLAKRGNPSSAGLAWPSFADRAFVMSLVAPQPTPESDFAAAHHCAFWALP